MENLKKYIEENNISNSHELADKLLEELGIKCRKEDDANGNTLFTFKYDQINSPKSSPIVMECRGIVLDEAMNVAFKGFDRFYNYGEMEEITSQFNWEDFDAFEKADGSLVKLYCYDGLWQVGTSGTATANVPFNATSWNTGGEVQTFREKILDAFGYTSEEEFQRDASSAFEDNLNYAFEYTSNENRIVTPYEYPEMVLLAAFKDGVEIDNRSLDEEYGDMRVDALNVRKADVYKVSCKNDLLKLVDNLLGLQEGAVVRDSNGMRLKIKSSLYVAAHRMRGENGLTVRNACKLVLAGEHEEYLTYFPDDSHKLRLVDNALTSYIELIQNEYDTKYSDIQEQKEFALRLVEKAFPYNNILFKMRKNGNTAHYTFHSLSENNKLTTLEKLITND